MTDLSLSPDGDRLLRDIAERHGFSVDAAAAMLRAMLAGGGSMAQFSHPEFGGMGQWSAGGMLMIGDMFNDRLRGRVAALAGDLSAALAGGALEPVRTGASAGRSGFGGGRWWPEELGIPSSSGGQNRSRYAVFPAARRLAVDDAGAVAVYDTGDHMISGVSQQQGGSGDLSFQSQYGTVRLGDLRRVDGGIPQSDAPGTMSSAAAMPDRPAAIHPVEQPATAPPPAFAQPAPEQPAYAQPPAAQSAPTQRAGAADDIFSSLERLAALHAKGILTDAEFTEKKRELLARL